MEKSKPDLILGHLSIEDLELLLSEAKIATWKMELPDGLVWFNETKSQLLGYPAEKFKHYNDFMELVHPDDCNYLIQKMKSLINDETENYDVIYRIKNRSGDYLWFKDVGRKDGRREDGKILIYGLAIDITHREDLNELVKNERELFTFGPAVIFRWINRENYPVKYVSPNITSVLGYRAEQFLCGEIKFTDIIHPDDKITLWEELKNVLNDKNILKLEKKYRLFAADGTLKNIEDFTIFNRDTNGNVIEIAAYCLDVTEKIKNQQMYLQESERFRLIAENTSDGIMVFENNEVKYVSPAYKSILGYDENEYLSHSTEDIFNLIHPEDRERIYNVIMQGISDKKRELIYSYRVKTKSGLYIWKEDHSKLIYDQKGIHTGAYIIGRDITERKKAEELLKRSEDKFRSIIESANAIIFILDTNGVFLLSQGEGLNKLGLNPDEAVGKSVFEMYDEDGELIKAVKRALSGESFSTQVKIKDFYFETTYRCIRDESGHFNYTIGISFDITEKMKMIQSLEVYSTLLNQVNISVITTDLEGKITYVNPYACESSGYREEELTGQNPRILKSDYTTKESYKELWDDITGGKTWRGLFQNKKKDGTYYWENAIISPIKNSDGLINSFVAIKENVDEKIKNDQELTLYRLHLEDVVEQRTEQIRQQNKFLETIINTIPSPIYIKNSENHFIDVNNCFAEYFRKKKEQIIGKENEEVFGKNIAEKFNRIEKESCESESKTETEIKGKSFVVYYSEIDLTDGKKGKVYLLVDISERKKAEIKILEAFLKEKSINEFKTNFISNTSHEFRTPFAAILTSADLLEMYFETWPKTKTYEYISRIQNSVMSMTKLLENVLTLSRYERETIKVNLQNDNLDKILSDVIEEYRKKEGKIEISYNYLIKKKKGLFDSKLIKVIIENLLDNSIKFAKSNCKIVLDVYQENKNIIIDVSDFGSGIPSGDQKNIFEPFYRCKNAQGKPGSGLGLTIVKKTIELYGGEIHLVKKDKYKTTFRVIINSKDLLW